MNNCRTRLDVILKGAFGKDICTFQEAITIIMCCHAIGTLEPIGAIEEVRRKLIAQFDGSTPNDQEFLESYDWVRVGETLHRAADSMCASGYDLDPNDLARELETLARWIRLTGGL